MGHPHGQKSEVNRLLKSLLLNVGNFYVSKHLIITKQKQKQWSCQIQLVNPPASGVTRQDDWGKPRESRYGSSPAGYRDSTPTGVLGQSPQQLT